MVCIASEPARGQEEESESETFQVISVLDDSLRIDAVRFLCYQSSWISVGQVVV